MSSPPRAEGGGWRLVSEDDGTALLIPEGSRLVVGRGATCDIHVGDDTVSRNHAELCVEPGGFRVRDLGSANGLTINGVPATEGRLFLHDVVRFGRVGFRLERDTSPPAPDAPEPGTQLRSVDVRSGGGALARLQAERLARLVELARSLSGEVDLDRVLSLVVDQAAALLPADRVALLLADPSGDDFRLAHWRNRLGKAAVEVPRSIARRAAAERAPVLTESALHDARFQSGSVVASQVRAALCVPLLTEQERVLGVLYVDSLTAAAPFSENEAALCFAFGGLAAVSIAKAEYAEAARREAVARANLERYFAPGVAARIAGQRSGARPGGARVPVTVLFSDIRGFTRLAETLPPEAVAAQLSEYFGAMVEVVFAQGGTLDKFIGDALLAVWGAPVASADDTERALAAARAMEAEVNALNGRWAREARPVLGVGIGIHQGEAFAGTIGSPRRLEYTVIGDVVNVAARLCKAAGAGQIVISDAALGRLPLAPASSPLAPLELRGRERPVAAHLLA